MEKKLETSTAILPCRRVRDAAARLLANIEKKRADKREDLVLKEMDRWIAVRRDVAERRAAETISWSVIALIDRQKELIGLSLKPLAEAAIEVGETTMTVSREDFAAIAPFWDEAASRHAA